MHGVAASFEQVFSDRKGPATGAFGLENPGPGAAQQESWREHAIGGGGREVMFLQLADLDQDGYEDVPVAVKPREIQWLRRLDRTGRTWQPHAIPLPDSPNARRRANRRRRSTLLLSTAFLNAGFLLTSFLDDSFLDDSFLDDALLGESLLGESLLGESLLDDSLLDDSLLDDSLLSTTFLLASFLNDALLGYSTAGTAEQVKGMRTADDHGQTETKHDYEGNSRLHFENSENERCG